VCRGRVVSEHEMLPDRLRQALEADHGMVRALRPAAVRALWVAVWAALALFSLPVAIGMRGDVAGLGFTLSWGAAAVECAAGLALVVLALREAVPGSGVTAPVGSAALAVSAGVLILVAVLSWLRRGVPVGSFPPEGAHCFPMESTLALPALALTLLLVGRAYAVRPRWAGVLGGVGAGLLTDGVWHMICPYAELSHVLVWHGGAVLALAGLGWLLGAAIEAERRRRLSSRG
jgi:hypothetical protein